MQTHGLCHLWAKSACQPVGADNLVFEITVVKVLIFSLALHQKVPNIVQQRRGDISAITALQPSKCRPLYCMLQLRNLLVVIPVGSALNDPGQKRVDKILIVGKTRTLRPPVIVRTSKNVVS